MFPLVQEVSKLVKKLKLKPQNAVYVFIARVYTIVRAMNARPINGKGRLSGP